MTEWYGRSIARRASSRSRHPQRFSIFLEFNRHRMSTIVISYHVQFSGERRVSGNPTGHALASHRDRLVSGALQAPVSVSGAERSTCMSPGIFATAA